MAEAAANLTGRDASVARRRMMSQGKAALPPASERSGAGFRLELQGLRAPAVATEPRPAPAPEPTAAPAAPPQPMRLADAAMSGREAAIERRRLLAQGKAAVAAAMAERNRAAAGVSAAEPGESVASPPPATSAAVDLSALAGREAAMARRALLARVGGAFLQPRPVERPSRKGDIPYAPKVVEAKTEGGVRVTGHSEAVGRQVTGLEAGREKPISGTSCIGPGEGAFRASGQKVGLARTPGGLVVSGTMVRSRVRITGDEASATRRITGEADPTLDDDLSPRPQTFVPVAAQFERQANPHGASVFGTNLGRSVRHMGSRERSRERALEVTEGGAPISGSAIGRSARVTGDEPGACRALTGTQYLSPAAEASACGGAPRGPHPMAGGAAARKDPVTGAKVSEIQTWGGQRVTGTDVVEHVPAVTGDEPGECRIVTGTPYLGPETSYGYCPADVGPAQEARLPRPAPVRVTGDVPLHDASRVSGTERGAALAVTGSPYWREAPAAAPAEDADPVRAAAEGFSIRTPQREAQLKRRGDAPPPARRITGAFAVGDGKLTGDLAFDGVPRFRPDGEGKSARLKITGHGSVAGPAITGSAWSEDSRVTGTEGFFAAQRNPSLSDGEPQGFAGARSFKRKSPHEAPRRLVTGVIGWTPKSAAIVTLSGGAQG